MLKHFRFSLVRAGPIPESIGQLTRLQWLSLSNNKLTGRIPESMGQLVQLSNMYLSENELTGEGTCFWFSREHSWNAHVFCGH